MKIRVRDRTGGQLAEAVGGLYEQFLDCTLEDTLSVAGSLYRRGLDVTLEHASERGGVDAVLWVHDFTPSNSAAERCRIAPMKAGTRTRLAEALTQATAAAAGCNTCKGRSCPCTVQALAILSAAIRDVIDNAPALPKAPLQGLR